MGCYFLVGAPSYVSRQAARSLLYGVEATVEFGNCAVMVSPEGAFVERYDKMRLVPFGVAFVGREEAEAGRPAADPELLDRLKTEGEGVLAWAVRGAAAYRAGGLGEPEAVARAVAAYRAESDPLGAFLESACIVGEGCAVLAGVVYRAYERWAQDQGLTRRERLTATAFGRRMGERFSKRKTKKGLEYQGVGLRLE